MVTKLLGGIWAVLASLLAATALSDGLILAAVLLLLSGLIAAPIRASREKLAQLGVEGGKLAGGSAIAALAGLIVLGATIKETPEARLAREKAEQIAVMQHKAKARERAAEAKAVADKKSAEETRKRASGFHCLSSWDGSHREIVQRLKVSLREPDSFEHIETRIAPVNKKGFHILMMSYRARNGFGGMNVGRLAATVKSADCSFEIVANADE